jgi:hypothetical protein
MEYARLGDGQFSNLGGGVGANAFIQRSLGARHFLEIGASATRHVFYLVCVWSPCRDRHATLVGVYGQAALRPTLRSPAVIPYVGPRLGVLLGDFQDGSAGVDLAGVGGLKIAIGSRVDLDIGAAASIVYVDDPPPQASRAAWDWRLALRAGLVMSMWE